MPEIGLSGYEKASVAPYAAEGRTSLKTAHETAVDPVFPAPDPVSVNAEHPQAASAWRRPVLIR